MPPFATTFNREDVAANQALVSPILNSSQLASNTPSLTLPDLNQTDPRELQGVISSIPTVDQLIQASNAPSALETEQQDVRSAIERSLGILGTQDQRLAEEQAARGIPEQTQQLQDITGRLRQLQAESLAIPLQIQEEFTGRGATRGGVEPIQTSRLRQNAIQSLTLGAQAQALQGNIALAEQQAAKAVELEFAPEKARLDFFKRLYEYNREDLERLDKKRADALKIQLNERERILEGQIEERKGVQNVLLTASKFGASEEIKSAIASSRTIDEAILNARGSLRDPAAIAELESLRLGNILKQEQIATARRKRELLGVPSEKELEADRQALRNAESSIQAANDKVLLIGGLKTHPGLKARVGANVFTRGVFSGTSVISDIGGGGDEFAGSVHRLVNGLTLDELISAKDRGATFGALSEGELNTLASSASAINDWEIKRNGVGTGRWDIDEASFKRELDRIMELTNRAISLSQDKLIDPETRAVLDAAYQLQDNDPSLYY